MTYCGLHHAQTKLVILQTFDTRNELYTQILYTHIQEFIYKHYAIIRKRAHRIQLRDFESTSCSTRGPNFSLFAASFPVNRSDNRTVLNRSEKRYESGLKLCRRFRRFRACQCQCVGRFFASFKCVGRYRSISWY